MKSSIYSKIRRGLITSTVLGSCLIADNSLAQIIIPASIPETPITSLPNNADIVVNCDMMQTPNGQLKAIAFDDGISQAYFYVEDFTGNSVIINLPNGSIEPDIVLADDLNNPGVDYIVGVVYMLGTDAFFDTYSITNVGSGLTFTQTNSVQLIGGCGTGVANSPHIDMFSDANNAINGLPSLHEYAITWSESIAGCGIFILTDDFYPLFFMGNSPIDLMNFGAYYGDMTDITALTDIMSGDKQVCVVYRNFNVPPLTPSNLELVEYSVTSGGIINSSVLDVANWIFIPRIEAMSQHDPNFVKWQVTASVFPNAGNRQIMGYNNFVAPIPLSAPLFSTFQIDASAVAAGIGPNFSGDIGNTQYTTGFFPWQGNDLYAQDIDVATGNLNSIDYYQMNLNPVNYPFNNTRSMAISSSSNSGFDLLSAWYDGSDIVYKLSGNSMAFKTTAIHYINKSQTKLFPNPAQNHIIITGSKGATYNISDISGRVLLNGSLENENATVNLNSLSSGIYFLNINSIGKPTENIKFIKE